MRWLKRSKMAGKKKQTAYDIINAVFAVSDLEREEGKGAFSSKGGLTIKHIKAAIEMITEQEKERKP